jgi:hypothetical protein
MAKLQNKMNDEHEQVENLERTKSDIIEDEYALASGYVAGTDEEKKLVRKIDLYLLPTIFLMYLLSYMDRTK